MEYYRKFPYRWKYVILKFASKFRDDPNIVEIIPEKPSSSPFFFALLFFIRLPSTSQSLCVIVKKDAIIL